MKRFFSLLLAVALLCSMLPQITLGVSAAGGYNAQTVVSLANQQVNGEWPNGWCLAYIATVFNQSYGFDGNVYSSCCAYQNGNRFIDATSRADIPLGACVYFGGSDVVCGCGNYAGHVAIHVGNNNVVHAWAGRIVCTSIDYVVNCGYPYRGYGWYADQALQAVCSHNYTSVETPASCTENGIREYTCSSCGDTYSEPIEALGHNYVGVKTDATCTTAGYTTYTCSRCNDNYVEKADGWSAWSTEYPTGIPENLIERKTQYSTLEKEYITSTGDTLEGWISCGTTYSDWGTAQTTTTKPTESDTLRLTNTTQTGWGYYHWCNNYNDSGSWGVDSVDCAGASYYHSYVSGTALPQMAFTDQGGQTAYGGTGSGASPCAYNFYVWFRDAGADVYTYSYQTRSEVNLFYRWSDTWSDWSDEEITSSEDRQVKTQTVYRYYIGELADHDYSYAVTKEPTATETGVLTGTCAGCFDTATETLPKLNTTDYTYSQIKAPSYTETGTGRYTWKTTAYGNFCFDVTLEKLVDANAPQYQLISASGLAGTTVEVYIAIKNNPGIISLRNTITYDASALELVKVEDLGLLAGYTTPAATLQSPYTLRWADSLATANNMANGDLVRLTFKISESALVGDCSVSVAHIESRDVNGAKVKFNAASGTVSVIECVIGDTDGDGEVSDWDAIVLNRYLAGWSVEAELLAADVDGDGEISDWDAIVLERYLAGWNIELGK